MNNIKLVEPPQEKFSWANEVLELKKGEKFKADIKYAKTITPIISRDVKYREPDREFNTDRKSEPEFLIVERTN